MEKIFCSECFQELKTIAYDIGIYAEPCKCRKIREQEISELSYDYAAEIYVNSFAEEAEHALELHDDGDKTALEEFATDCYKQDQIPICARHYVYESIDI